MKNQIKLFRILLVIFIGGTFGTMFRWLIHFLTDDYLFPFGTVVENISGSFLLGILAGWVAVKAIPVLLKEGVGTGFCGGFTTMSTFAADALYLQEGAGLYTASIYISVSIAGGLIAAALGMMFGSKMANKRQEGIK